MAAVYQYSNISDIVIRLADNAHIPNDPTNRDYSEYLKWRAVGNVPDPYVEDPEVAAQRGRRENFNADTMRQELLTQLRNATPDQINTYVNNQVTDLASARTLLKKILLVIAII